jgi:hypothetical protein
MWRLLSRDEVLDRGEIGDADHADVPVAPRLRGRPLDEVVAVALFLLREPVVEDAV